MGAILLAGILLILYLAISLFKPGRERVPSGTPETVVVTVLDDATMNEQYIKRVVENRKFYAEQHGMKPSASCGR